MPEVVAFGEAMIRLTPPGYRRLEQATSFEIEVGGAELNTAVGLARLGHAVEWVSRLPDDPLGHLVANKVREAGVGVRHILFASEERVGLYFLEMGAAPRPSAVHYDRKNSAASRITPEMFDFSVILKGAKWFHMSGITPALGPLVAQTVLVAMRAAKSAGLTVSLDPNYRAKLWDVETASRWLREAMPTVDVLVSNRDDLSRFFGLTAESISEAGEQLAGQFGVRTLALTAREDPLAWRNRLSAWAWCDGRTFETRSYEVEIVDRLGAGDAFVSGLIHGLLNGDVQQALDWAAAMGALAHTVPGDLPWLNITDIQAALSGGLRVRR